MSSRSGDIIFLLGAGASKEAEIPMSAEMINEIEELLKSNGDWQPFHELYNHVKSSIHYSAGLKGVYGRNVPFNIETLVNTLYELERNEEHPLYPFIAAWNSRFVSLACADFSNVQKFRRLILQELKKWMCPENTSASSYYDGLKNLQNDLNYPLHVFSLNYDLCVEGIGKRNSFRIETGFEDCGPSHFWDWERFEQQENGPPSVPDLYLYKLHGSINWKRNAEANLFSVEQTENVASDKMEVIFGRDFKLEAADPYLFYAYQFRKFTLDARLIVVIGYSFSDSHINKMLVQALRRDENKRLLVVSRSKNRTECKQKVAEVAKRLEVDESLILAETGSAKTFLELNELAEKLHGHIPEIDGTPF